MAPLATIPATLRRRGYTAALLAFRRSPAPLRRALVRAATPGFTVGAVVAITHREKVLFLRQPHREGWSLPGGLLDRGESAEHAVVREVREETGLRIEVGPPLTCQVNSPLRRVDVIYRIEVDHEPEVRVGGEAKAHAWYGYHELPSADGPTHEIVALLRAVGRSGAASGRLLDRS